MINTKIGILTYHWVANYGANLQMFSTYSYLLKKGLSPIVINYVPKSAIEFYKVFAGEKQMRCHFDFLNQHCETTREFSELSEFNQVLNDYKITHLIVGSDSLFNLIKPSAAWKKSSKIRISDDHKFPNPFWCQNIDIPHVALSVSSQNCKYKDFKEEKNNISDSLSGFKIITVRDEWTQKMVEYFSDNRITPQITPDPVFGFNDNVDSDSTPESIRRKFGLPDKYVLFTFNKGRMSAPKKWMAKIKQELNALGYSCVYLPKSTGCQDLDLDYKISMPIDPIDWYNLIKFSNGYIGVLMHPIVICLHNAVPCYSFDHYGTGPILFSNQKSSKIYHIMQKANLLENHFYLRNHLFFPNPETVLDRIVNFPVDEIKQFSKKQQEECRINFDLLINALIEHQTNNNR